MKRFTSALLLLLFMVGLHQVTFAQSSDVVQSNDGISESQFVVFPNPSAGQFTLRYEGPPVKDNVTINIYDPIGRLVVDENGSDCKLCGDFNLELDDDEVEDGAYILVITVGQTRITKRLLIQ